VVIGPCRKMIVPYYFWEKIISSFRFDTVDYQKENDCDPFKAPITSNLHYMSILCEDDLSLEAYHPQNGCVEVDGVENGRFYAANGDDNFIVTEA
jgi:hypothetical protein